MYTGCVYTFNVYNDSFYGKIPVKHEHEIQCFMLPLRWVAILAY